MEKSKDVSEKSPQRFSPWKQFHGSFIPNGLLACKSLTATAKLLWARLGSYAGKGGVAWPSLATLASDLGCSKSTIQAGIKTLVEQRFIERETATAGDILAHKTRRYYFLEHPVLSMGVSHTREYRKSVLG